MLRLPISKGTFIAVLLVAAIGSQEVLAAQVRGRVVKVVCSGLTSLYITCRSRPLRTTVDVASVKVDGSVSRRRVSTNRAGRFSIRLASGYYEFEARPPRLGMPSMPVEVTVPPQGTTITLKVDARTRLSGNE